METIDFITGIKKFVVMEDFVPFELAKKLEEKGFKTENTNWCYLDGELVQVKKYVNISPYEYAPTISQVLKWLRETHNIYIVVFIDDDTDKPVTFEIYKGTECVMCEHSYYSLAEWDKAEMDAIEYVLDNLI